MARNPLPYTPKRVNISIEDTLHEESQRYAASVDMDFSELVARLLVGEMRSKTGLARRFPRRLNMEASK